MPLPIEDYAMISDCQSAAMIGRDGSIDWLCFPRYDSASMFGALLGDETHGRWLLAPAEEGATASRSYIENTFILVTRWTTSTGEVEVTEFMPHGNRAADIVRRVRGVSGSVVMQQDLRIRFDYARAVPWVRQATDEEGPGIIATAGPDAVIVRGPRLKAKGESHRGTFPVQTGETVDVVLAWYPSYREAPPALDVDTVLGSTKAWWDEWTKGIAHQGRYHEQVLRSLTVLRALTHEDTGGIAAAATTSLPEQFGGARNWDYRFTWLRDASLALSVLINHGYLREAAGWRGWLLRAIAGDPADVQIMYGLGGERDLPERELTNFPGYQGASPVRIGNGAVDQFQADVIGEVMVALQEARERGVPSARHAWPVQRSLMKFTEQNWQRKDSGIWEMRGAEQYFTHSRVMVWAAFDRAIKAHERFGLDGPVERWQTLRSRIEEEIEEQGFDRERNTYVQVYGSKEVDASLLILPQVGYVKATDPRMLGTVAAIEQDLMPDGLVMRYRTQHSDDGLVPGEYPFLACSFWLVEQYATSGRHEDALALMDRLVGLANDVGLLSEEYDVVGRRQAGNTPQALSHLALVRAADAIESGKDMRGR
ncbi:glycoside hydrolase family 15 protein [uncultured Amnibacterium sp.]|uniref:glycoside hydrolase family 15 protein n=1 Tax=uncultured Amnibacterium sp. TaxID=1631851 RepID=UPI0035CB03BA